MYMLLAVPVSGRSGEPEVPARLGPIPDRGHTLMKSFSGDMVMRSAYQSAVTPRSAPGIRICSAKLVQRIL